MAPDRIRKIGGFDGDDTVRSAWRHAESGRNDLTLRYSQSNNNVNIGGFGGAQTSNLVEPRRTYRWVFNTIGRGPGQFSRAELLLLKTAARPKYKYEPATMDHNQETISFAGKTKWEPIELTWYDTEQNPDIARGLYQWFGSVSDLPNANVAHPSQYKKTASLSMLNSAGAPSETWTLYGAWPAEFDGKGLDYTSNELQTCGVKMQFDRALRECGVQALIPTVTTMC